MRLICLVLLLGGLAACAAPVAPPEPKPEPPSIPLFEASNPGPWCGYALRLGLNPDADPAQKASVEALAKQRGC